MNLDIDLSWQESIGGEVTRKSEPYLPGSKDQGKIEKISLTVKVNELDSVVSRRTIFYTVKIYETHLCVRTKIENFNFTS